MPPDTQATFRAIADPTRRDILALLAMGDRTIGDVASQFSMTRPAVRKHLQVLEDGALITVEPRGRERITRLTPGGLGPVRDWLGVFDSFWDDRLTALAVAIEKDPTP